MSNEFGTPKLIEAIRQSELINGKTDTSVPMSLSLPTRSTLTKTENSIPLSPLVVNHYLLAANSFGFPETITLNSYWRLSTRNFRSERYSLVKSYQPTNLTVKPRQIIWHSTTDVAIGTNDFSSFRTTGIAEDYKFVFLSTLEQTVRYHDCQSGCTGCSDNPCDFKKCVMNRFVQLMGDRDVALALDEKLSNGYSSLQRGISVSEQLARYSFAGRVRVTDVNRPLKLINYSEPLVVVYVGNITDKTMKGPLFEGILSVTNSTFKHYLKEIIVVTRSQTDESSDMSIEKTEFEFHGRSVGVTWWTAPTSDMVMCSFDKLSTRCGDKENTLRIFNMLSFPANQLDMLFPYLLHPDNWDLAQAIKERVKGELERRSNNLRQKVYRHLFGILCILFPCELQRCIENIVIQSGTSDALTELVNYTHHNVENDLGLEFIRPLVMSQYKLTNNIRQEDVVPRLRAVKPDKLMTTIKSLLTGSFESVIDNTLSVGIPIFDPALLPAHLADCRVETLVMIAGWLFGGPKFRFGGLSLFLTLWNLYTRDYTFSPLKRMIHMILDSHWPLLTLFKLIPLVGPESNCPVLLEQLEDPAVARVVLEWDMYFHSAIVAKPELRAWAHVLDTWLQSRSGHLAIARGFELGDLSWNELIDNCIGSVGLVKPYNMNNKPNIQVNVPAVAVIVMKEQDQYLCVYLDQTELMIRRQASSQQIMVPDCHWIKVNQIEILSEGSYTPSHISALDLHQILTHPVYSQLHELLHTLHIDGSTGKLGSSMELDADYDAAVWNQNLDSIRSLLNVHPPDRSVRVMVSYTIAIDTTSVITQDVVQALNLQDDPAHGKDVMVLNRLTEFESKIDEWIQTHKYTTNYPANTFNPDNETTKAIPDKVIMQLVRHFIKNLRQTAQSMELGSACNICHPDDDSNWDVKIKMCQNGCPLVCMDCLTRQRTRPKQGDIVDMSVYTCPFCRKYLLLESDHFSVRNYYEHFGTVPDKHVARMCSSRNCDRIYTEELACGANPKDTPEKCPQCRTREESNSMNCPRCTYGPLVHGSGCYHMTCPKCDEHFCGKCSRSIRLTGFPEYLGWLQGVYWRCLEPCTPDKVYTRYTNNSAVGTIYENISAPLSTTPSDTTPSDPTPSDPTPSDTTLINTTPSDTTLINITPSDTTLIDTTPSAASTDVSMFGVSVVTDVEMSGINTPVVVLPGPSSFSFGTIGTVTGVTSEQDTTTRLNSERTPIIGSNPCLEAHNYNYRQHVYPYTSEWSDSYAEGIASHSEGIATYAGGMTSHAEGVRTIHTDELYTNAEDNIGYEGLYQTSRPVGSNVGIVRNHMPILREQPFESAHRVYTMDEPEDVESAHTVYRMAGPDDMPEEFTSSDEDIKTLKNRPSYDTVFTREPYEEAGRVYLDETLVSDNELMEEVD